MREGRLIKVDKVDNLTESNVKCVKVTADGAHEEYMYNGDINELVKKLSQKNLQNLYIEEPSLEDMFMHFYEGKEEK